MKSLVALFFVALTCHGDPIPRVAVDVPSGARENVWASALAATLPGVSEYSVTHGRVDVLTDTLAIEVDRLPSLSCAIGQAVHYRFATERQGVVAVIQDHEFTPADLEKLEYFRTVCASVDLELWIVIPKTLEPGS